MKRMIEIHLIVTMAIVVSSLLAVVLRDLIKSVILLAIMSLLLSLEFYLLHAPDVAITEAAVGAGLTTAIYIIAISKTERWESEKKD